jgi:hypothetical protein
MWLPPSVYFVQQSPLTKGARGLYFADASPSVPSFASACASAPTPAPPEEGTDALQNLFYSALVRQCHISMVIARSKATKQSQPSDQEIASGLLRFAQIASLCSDCFALLRLLRFARNFASLRLRLLAMTLFTTFSLANVTLSS